jgi:hypothetical protein
MKMGKFKKGGWLAGAVALTASVVVAAFGAVVAAPAGATGESEPQPLLASKTAVGSWERTFKWTIDKSVTPDSWALATGQSGTSTYTVAVTKTLDSEIVKVSGEVCVENVGSVPTENLTIVDRLQVDTGSGFISGEFLFSVPLDLSANPVLDPGESHCYAYSIPFTPVAGAVGYRNNAAVRITNDPRHPGTAFGPNEKADFNLPPPTLVNDTINVDDTNGMSWLFTDSGSQSYTKTFTCDQDAGSHDNTATIRETGQSDSASVTVTCTPPPGGCTHTLGYWKTHSTYGPASKPDPTWNLVGGPDAAFFSSGMSWYQLFSTSSAGGNAYVILAHQYMAAMLNQLDGAASTPAVDAALAWANTFFATYTPSSSLTKAVRGQAIAAADVLDDYNNGDIGPGHCDDASLATVPGE